MNKAAKYKRCLSSYLHDPVLATFYIESIYATLRQLGDEYPNFHSWFFKKVATGLNSGEREIIFTVSEDNYISGIVILKNTISEKKICTIRVPERFQQRGIGRSLIFDSLHILNFEKPLISVAEHNLYQFTKLFFHYGFKKTQEYRNAYLRNQNEIVFNGLLIP